MIDVFNLNVINLLVQIMHRNNIYSYRLPLTLILKLYAYSIVEFFKALQYIKYIKVNFTGSLLLLLLFCFQLNTFYKD